MSTLLSATTIVYWYPMLNAPPAGRPTARQWSLPEALSSYVNVVVMSLPHDQARSLWVQEVAPSLTIIYGAFARTSRSPVRLRGLASRVDRIEARRVLRSIGVIDLLLWLSWGDRRYVLDDRRPHRMVYDCIDPGLDGQDAELDREERHLCSVAGGAFATAEQLRERVAAWSTRAASLPNGCSDLGPLRSRPRRRRPIVGFLGTIDQRISVELIAAAAHRLPGMDFVIGGRVNPSRAGEVDRLASSFANVSVLGPVPAEAGRTLTESFDVGLIPFKENPVCDAINPVKMYTYLERGVGVAATDVRECRERSVVSVGSSPDEFAAAIEHEVCAPSARREERREFALGETWDHRARAAIVDLDSWGLLR